MLQFSHLFRYIMFAVPVTVTILDTVGSIALVNGDSMAPTLNPSNETSRDIVLIDKISIAPKLLQRGDIVILDSPTDPKRQIVKRLIGLSGDWVKKRNGDLQNISKGKCWIEGDNHETSERYGPLPLPLIRAKVVCVIWPPSRWGWVNNEDQHTKDRLFIANNERDGDFPRRINNDSFW